MIIVREHVHIGPHVVHNHCEPLKQGIHPWSSCTLSSRSHTSVPEPGHSQHEPPSAPTKFYKPSARCAPDRTQADIKHETSSRPPCCWRRIYPSILERGSSSAGHSLCPPWHPKGSDPFHGGTLPSAYYTYGSSFHRSVEDRTPFLVRYPWILDWLESIKTRTGSATT
jgi:hypothetical protein